MEVIDRLEFVHQLPIRGEEGEHGDGGGEEERSDEEEAEASSPFGAEAGGNGDEDARCLEKEKDVSRLNL